MDTKQLIERIVSKAKLLDLPKLKTLLEDAVSKQKKGELNAEYITSVAPKILACIKEDAQDEVKKLLENFTK